MANTDIVTRAGAGAALTSGDHDQNMKSLAGIVEEINGAFTVDYQDQGKTIECNNIGAIAVTLGTAASIIAAGDTTTFQITFKNVGIGVTTITRSGTDTIDNATSVVLNDGDSITLQTNAANTSWKVIARDMDVVDINGGTIDGATIGASSADTVKASTFEGASGTTINEFSIDGTLAGNSDDAVPTEKAVKAALAALPTHSGTNFTTTGTTQLGEATNIPTTANQVIVSWTEVTGSAVQPEIFLGDSSYAYGTSTVRNRTNGGLTANATGGVYMTDDSYTNDATHGTVTFTRVHGTQIWAVSGNLLGGNDTRVAGYITVTGTTDRIKITVASGTFDAGTASVYWL